MARTDLTIVLPAYHEAKRIGSTLDELAIFLKTDNFFKIMKIEVLVVSANSPDKTHSIVRSKQSKFESLKLLLPGDKVGKGRDVQYGMLRAKGRAVIFMDADLATPLSHLMKFYKAYENGADLVVATRNILKHHPSLSRRVLSNVGNILFRMAGGVWIEDSQCGFKLFSAKAAELCFSRLNILGWGFDMEILAIARANKLKIVSYRINDWVSVENGTFSSSAFANSMSSLAELAMILRNRISGRYVSDYTKPKRYLP